MKKIDPLIGTAGSFCSDCGAPVIAAAFAVSCFTVRPNWPSPLPRRRSSFPRRPSRMRAGASLLAARWPAGWHKARTRKQWMTGGEGSSSGEEGTGAGRRGVGVRGRPSLSSCLLTPSPLSTSPGGSGTPLSHSITAPVASSPSPAADAASRTRRPAARLAVSVGELAGFSTMVPPPTQLPARGRSPSPTNSCSAVTGAKAGASSGRAGAGESGPLDKAQAHQGQAGGSRTRSLPPSPHSPLAVPTEASADAAVFPLDDR